MAEEKYEDDDKLVEIDGAEYYEHFRFVADKGQELLRVDKFLVARLQKSSRNRIQQAADAGCIIVNGKPVKSNYRVKPLDTVQVVIIARATSLKSWHRTFLSTSCTRTATCWW